jgi:hypothetical protein
MFIRTPSHVCVPPEKFNEIHHAHDFSTARSYETHQNMLVELRLAQEAEQPAEGVVKRVLGEYIADLTFRLWQSEKELKAKGIDP